MLLLSSILETLEGAVAEWTLAMLWIENKLAPQDPRFVQGGPSLGHLKKNCRGCTGFGMKAELKMSVTAYKNTSTTLTNKGLRLKKAH